jgi:tRNA (guanine-N7-)-methyltransferase
MYGLVLHKNSENIYAKEIVEPELQIKTYYESLDIAQSKQVYYICFSLAQKELPSLDHLLQERVKENEATAD